jgi:hypothetical protein
MPVLDTTDLLRKVLRLNATATAASGAVFLGLGHVLAPIFGLPALALQVLGGGFLAFAAHVWHTSRKPALTRADGLYFMAVDIAYVVATVVVMVAFPGLLSTAGRVVFALMADVVAVFAVGEYLGARRLARSQPAAA